MRREVNWADLRPMPRARNADRPKRRWDVRRDEYAELTKQPLIVTAELVTPLIHAERDCTHLDGILGMAALTTHPVESDCGQAAVIPLPLELAWVSQDGRPLWACTPLVPADRAIVADSREYWHKRYPGHRAEFGDKLNAVTSAGRWKEYRVPVHAQSVSMLAAACIGNAQELERLLGVVTHIGKKGSMGYGRVARWSASPAQHALDDVLARRPVPVAYFEGRNPVGQLSLNRGWTAPYWYSPWWADCMVPA